ncbi:MAG: hypothetical protein AAFO79_00280 [Pseudomonadota bacterium]
MRIIIDYRSGGGRKRIGALNGPMAEAIIEQVMHDPLWQPVTADWQVEPLIHARFEAVHDTCACIVRVTTDSGVKTTAAYLAFGIAATRVHRLRRAHELELETVMLTHARQDAPSARVLA